jgi:hypothetical protein
LELPIAAFSWKGCKIKRKASPAAQHIRFLFSNNAHSTNILAVCTPQQFLLCLQHAQNSAWLFEPPHVLAPPPHQPSDQFAFHQPGVCLLGLVHQSAVFKVYCSGSRYSLWIFGHRLQALQSRRGCVRRSCAYARTTASTMSVVWTIPKVNATAKSSLREMTSSAEGHVPVMLVEFMAEWCQMVFGKVIVVSWCR